MSSVHGKHAEKCSTNHTPGTHIWVDVCKLLKIKCIILWRRGASDPRPNKASTRNPHTLVPSLCFSHPPPHMYYTLSAYTTPITTPHLSANHLPTPSIS